MNKVFVSALLVLLVMISGCSSLQSYWNRFTNQDTTIDFVIENLEVAGQSGEVSLRGNASLPEGTRLAVAAVRSLEDIKVSEESPTYAILDRKFVTVKNSQWQTDLALRESNDVGIQFENWQSNFNLLPETLAPSPTVLFTVTLEPTSFSTDINELLTDAIINNGDSQISYTSNGEPYLQFSQLAAVQIPSKPTVQERNLTWTQYTDIWQERSNDSSTIDTLNELPPLPFNEKDNLPLPTSHMLQ